MQQALPYRTWLPPAAASASTTTTTTAAAVSGLPTSLPLLADENNGHVINSPSSVQKLVSENAIIVFGPRGCCMCHVVKLLLLTHGVNPTVFEVDLRDEADVIEELSRIAGGGEAGEEVRPHFPAVFVGGKLFGGLEKVMASHISGELVPILKEAGALWL